MNETALLPAFWTYSRLGDVIRPSSEKIDPFRAGDRPYVGLEHIEGGRRRLLGHGIAREVKSAKSVFRRGDVLYGKLRPYLRKLWLAEFDGVCSTDILVYSSTSALDAGYLSYVFLSDALTDHAVASSAGINLPRVNAEALSAFQLPLPPVVHQRRIVARLDEAFAKSSAARMALAQALLLADRLRSALLTAAVTGELTRNWRELYSDSTSSPTLMRNRPRRVDGMPAIPTSWRYVSVADLAAAGTVVTYGIVLPGPDVPNGVPYVRQQDIEEGRVKVDQLARTSSQIAAKHERSSLREGDVLLCIIRPLRVAIVPAGIDGANLTQGTVRIRPADFIAADYLATYLGAPPAQEWMKQCYIGMAMPRINVKDARAVPVAVPPLAEQHEIMRRLRESMEILDRQQATAREMLAQLERLEQATLSKAFRGDLVPQEPGDEPPSSPIAPANTNDARSSKRLRSRQRDR